MSSSTDRPQEVEPTPASAPAPRSRLKGWLQNLALMFGSFLLCLALAEGILRLAGYGNVEIYQPDPILYWKLKPNQDCSTKIDRRPVHVNSRGTRGPEFAVPKPPGTYRILSLGDSKTFGWGLREEETYSKRMERLLQDQADRAGARQHIEVINGGVIAWSYPQMHHYLREYGMTFQPDMVILGDANLWTQFSEQNSPEFIRSFMNRVRLKNFLRRFALYHYVVEYKLREVYERQRAKFVPVDPGQDTLFKAQQQKDPDAFFRHHIEGLCRLALTNGVQPVLLYMPTLAGSGALDTTRVLLAKAQVSRELGVPLIDSSDAMKPLGKDLFLDADPVHLNVPGNDLIARLLATNVYRLVMR
jgi:hypothetical protein